MRQLLFILLASATASAQLSYPPDADTAGTTAIPQDSNTFVAWATEVTVQRGYVQISDPTIEFEGSNMATYGTPDDAIGIPGSGALSLGDAGTAIATFAAPITNGDGFDFAVFENGSNTFLELAFVEVSSDGVNYFRFPAHSETQTNTSLGGFGLLDARNLNNLAGKYRVGYGTPFDLSDVPDNALLNKNQVTHIKIVDVVGSLDPAYATYDSLGNKVNDPYPTPFNTSGFDLTGIGVINEGVLAVKEVEGMQLSVYPIPASTVLNIKTNLTDTVYVTIYDVASRLVYSAQMQGSTQIDLTAFTAGVYFVHSTANGKTAVKQIVVNR
ncbi:T9SS type A sorting domain-containing protein [Flavobacterium zepuense]|uniref:T9SS type A sorting domain-containing protein n=1 Tax=Flavobacterium zepuense TaxID=2593302 RepID=A0A552VAI0_9FLAO|nr:T9SS type A sorting domain-containing protein [Flavobacterium zepuense]TRW27485.1 T9SS type A sorting domain-containing protein [Flavobacterium zepuense]